MQRNQVYWNVSSVDDKMNDSGGWQELLEMSELRLLFLVQLVAFYGIQKYWSRASIDQRYEITWA